VRLPDKLAEGLPVERGKALHWPSLVCSNDSRKPKDVLVVGVQGGAQPFRSMATRGWGGKGLLLSQKSWNKAHPQRFKPARVWV
jgi:hypothetical protein